jgi:hypothetical protein
LPKVAIILLAANDTPEGTGRMANALTTALEFHEAGDEVRLMFDGAGVTWIPRLTDAEEKYSRLFERVRPVVAGACLYCARAYGVKDAVEEADVPFVSDFKDHPSVRGLVTGGFQVITF